MPILNYKNSQAAIFSVCLLIAILFWIITALNKILASTVLIPVVYKNTPLSFQFETPLPAYISVDIEAKGFDLISNDFSKSNSALVVDFNSPVFKKTELKSNTVIITSTLLNTSFSTLNSKYRILKTVPDSIVIGYSKKFTAKIPVKLNAQLNYRKQYFNSMPPVLKPDSIEISGPEILLKNITFLETQNSSFNNIDKNLFFSALIVNPANEKIILSDKKVWVYIPVEEFTEGKINVPITKIYYNNKPVTLIPDKVQITYRAPFKTFSLIGSDDFEAQVDQPALSISNNENKLVIKMIKFPKAARFVSMQPEIVDYLIEK